MRSVRRAHPRSDESRATRRDSGATLIEILIAVVLLGTVAAATLGALRTTIIGIRIERDHAKAYQWLQSANGVLQASERVGCDFDPVADAPFTSGEEKMRLTYQDIVRTDVVNPPTWEDRQLTVLPPVKIWDGTQYWDPDLAPKSCYDPDGFLLQLITMEVTNPSGEIIETIEVVKRD